MDNIAIEVAYGTSDKQKLYALTVPSDTTARQAALAAGIAADFPDARPESAPLGIFGKAVKDNHILQAGDRVEIYRPLLADPKETRRKRVATKKT